MIGIEIQIAVTGPGIEPPLARVLQSLQVSIQYMFLDIWMVRHMVGIDIQIAVWM